MQATLLFNFSAHFLVGWLGSQQTVGQGGNLGRGKGSEETGTLRQDLTVANKHISRLQFELADALER